MNDLAFNQRLPELVVVDDFFRDPDAIRDLALQCEYHSDLRFFKGQRSTIPFLWPYLREEFGRLLGRRVTRWMEHDANGVFQMTAPDDPLVWHHDLQSYAGAVYLTPDAPPSWGTSFWRDMSFGARKAPFTDEQKAVVYDDYNLVNPDVWERLDTVAGLYNRLVLWDASLIHSATSYQPNGPDGRVRLVQLFFFDV